MHNRFTRQILAVALAAATAVTSVIPSGAYAAETADAGATIAAEEEITVAEEAADISTEEAAEESKEEVPAEEKTADASQEEETAPAPEEKAAEGTTAEKENVPAPEEKADEGASVQEEKSEDPAPAEESAKSDTAAAAEEEPATEEKAEKKTFRIRFDEGAGTIKVVFGSDEGADKDDPSVRIDKKDGEKASAKARNEKVDAMIVDNNDYALEVSLDQGETIRVYSEQADGFNVAEYSIETDAGGKKDLNASDDSFNLDEDTVLTVKTEKEETKEETGKVYVNLMSDGGTVTITGNEKTYVVAKDEKGNVSVTENGKAVSTEEGKYAFAFDAADGKEMTVTAKSDKGVVTAFSIGGEGGSSFEKSDFKAEDRLAEFSQKFTVSKDAAKVISVSFADMPEFKGEQKVGRVNVKVEAERGIFPAGTTFKAVDIFDKEHMDIITNALISDDVYPKAAVDITFYDKSGKEIQPNGMVKVSFEDYNDSFIPYTDDMVVVHVTDDGEAEEIKSETNGNEIVVENDKFSPYVLLGYSDDKSNVPSPSSDNGSFTGKEGKPSSVTFGGATYHDYTYHGSTSTEDDYWETKLGHTRTISVTDSNGNKGTAVCVDPYMNGAESWTQKTKTNIVKITSANILKALYYGQYDTTKINSITGSSSKRDKWVLVHYAVCYYTKANNLISNSDFVNGEKSYSSSQGRDLAPYEAFWVFTSERLRSDVAKYMAYIESAPVPSGYTAYIVYPTGDKQPHGDQCYVYLVKDSEVYVYVRKISLNSEVTDSKYYSLSNAEFSVYDTEAHANAGGTAGLIGSAKTTEKVISTSADPSLKVGDTPAIKVGKPGTYWIREQVAPPKGYRLPSAVVKSIVVPASSSKDNPVHALFVDPYVHVTLQIEKSAEGMSDISKAPSLQGTEFTVYKDSAYKEKVGVLTVGANNKTNVLVKDEEDYYLPLGIYYVKETKTANGYETCEPFTMDATTIPKDDTGVLAVVQKVGNRVSPAEIEIVKKSSDEAITNGNGKYTLAGAQFGIYDNAECKGDPLMTITTDAAGKATTGELVRGDYWVKELKAPAAFHINEKIFPVTAADFQQTGKKTITVQETPKTDPIHIVIRKRAKGAGDDEKINTLEGTEFEVKFYAGKEYSSKAELEGKTADRTWTLTVYNAAKAGEAPIYMADFTHVSGDELYMRDGEAVLPLGTVAVTEKKAVDGYKNDPDFGGGSDILIAQVRIGEDGKIKTDYIVGGTIVDNDAVSVTDTKEKPEIGTVAKDVVTDTPLSKAGNEITIEDTVTYKNFIVGNEYTVKGRLVDKATGQTIKDTAGKDVTAQTTFTAQTINGSVKVTFNFKTDQSDFEGKSVVAFETAELDGKEIASHTKIDDEAQTIHFPKVRTTAAASETGEHVVPVGSAVKVTDTVSYENLIPGKTYTVKGTVVKKSDGKALGQKGSEVTAQFTPDKADGTTQLTFTIDTTGLKKQQLVVFEEVYVGTEVNKDKLIGEHRNINDKAQTVSVPDVTTDASDVKTKEKVIINNIEKDGSVSGVKYISDDVTFSGLETGKAYKIEGELKLQTPETDEKWSEAETVPSEVFSVDTHGNGKFEIKDGAVFFTPEGEDQFKDGIITIVFKYESKGYEGKDIVVGETITRKIKLAIHNDLKDTHQTVHEPKGETMAVDKLTDIKNSLAAENRIFKDTFRYENLEVGKEYVFTGFVVVADVDENEQPVKDENGNPVVHKIDSIMVDENGEPLADGCVKFTPSEKNGTLDLYFMIDATQIPNRDVTVFEDVTRLGENVIRHYVLDGTQTVYIPEGETEAIDSESQDHIAMPDEEVSIVDTFVFKNLIPGTEYTVTGRVMRKDDVTEVPSTLTEAAFAEEAQGTEISVKDGKVTFVPKTEDGALKLTFVFDGAELKGKDVVVYERAYHNDSEVIIHENINDEAQTVHLPDGRTEATDPDTDDHTMMAKGDITIRDRFFYENLLPGYEYAVHGKVMLKPAAEGEEPTELEAKMVDAEGNEITEWIFTPEQKDGSEDIFFVINADDLAGRSVVMFEEMEFINPELETRTVIIKHEDINDEDQTIHFPDGGTEALDSETEDHISNADTEVTIYDNLKFKNLIPGKVYTVKGTLIDKATEKPVMVNGEELTVTDEFVPEEADGSHIVTFTFDGSLLGGHTTVAYETVYSNGKEVFIHADIEDEDQTVHFPDGGTTATDDKTKGHTTYAEKKAVINDEVVYKNLIAGKEYTVTGVLMDKETNLPLLVNGKEVTASKTFTAEEPDGSIIISFKLDASELAGKSLVAFETVTYKDKEVFVHANIEDADQTVDIPSVKTDAKDKKDGDKTINPTGTVTVVDKVTYTNLTIGKKYVVTGTLMNKSTKKPARSGGKDITGQATFTAKEKDGVIEVEFKFNASDLATGDYVVFEELYEVNAETGEKVIVGDHKDINDKAQTVKRPEPPKPPRGARTGDTNMLYIWLAVAMAAIAAVAGIFIAKRRKGN